MGRRVAARERGSKVRSGVAAGGRSVMRGEAHPRSSLMLRLVAAAVILGSAVPAQADDKKVTVTCLGGAKKAPLEGLKVSIRSHTGDWSDDRRGKPLAVGKTGKDGAAAFALAPGRYYVDVES